MVQLRTAGTGGTAGSSSMNAVLLVEEDTTASGLFDRRTYYVQNWRHDVAAVTEADGDVKSMMGYTAYGEPAETMRADLDKDGNVDFGDFSIYASQSGTADCSGSGPVGCTADFDRDGDVDGDDTNVFSAENGDTFAGRLGVLSSSTGGRGYAGHLHDDSIDPSLQYMRARMYDSSQGRLLTPDPLGNIDSASRYAYVGGEPVRYTDPSGMCRSCPGGGLGGGTNWGTPPPTSTGRPGGASGFDPSLGGGLNWGGPITVPSTETVGGGAFAPGWISAVSKKSGGPTKRRTLGFKWRPCDPNTTNGTGSWDGGRLDSRDPRTGKHTPIMCRRLLEAGDCESYKHCMMSLLVPCHTDANGNNGVYNEPLARAVRQRLAGCCESGVSHSVCVESAINEIQGIGTCFEECMMAAAWQGCSGSCGIDWLGFFINTGVAPTTPIDIYDISKLSDQGAADALIDYLDSRIFDFDRNHFANMVRNNMPNPKLCMGCLLTAAVGCGISCHLNR